jgi:putative phage-type endonuclease
MMTTTLEPQVVCLPNTEEWKAARNTGIGSSEAAAAAGLSEWRTPLEVYYKKTGQLKIDLDNVASVRLGHLLEPIVVQEFCTLTGETLDKYPLPMCRHAVHPFVLATGDALLRSGKGLEAKTTTWRMASRLGDDHTDDVPIDILCQAQQQAAVYGWDAVWVSFLIDGRTLRNFHVERNDDLIEGLIDAERELWERIQNADPPEPDWAHPKTPQLIRQIYKSVKPGKRITFSPEMVEAQKRYEEIARQTKELDAEQKLIRAKQTVELGDAEAGFLGDGRMLRMKVVNRAGYTVKPSEYVDCRVVKADGLPFETAIAEPDVIESRFSEVQAVLLSRGYKLREQSESGSLYYVALGRPDVRVSNHPPNAATARYLLKSGGISIRVDAELWDLQTIEAALLN